jgi:hypothetical protein
MSRDYFVENPLQYMSCIERAEAMKFLESKKKMREVQAFLLLLELEEVGKVSEEMGVSTQSLRNYFRHAINLIKHWHRSYLKERNV